MAYASRHQHTNQDPGLCFCPSSVCTSLFHKRLFRLLLQSSLSREKKLAKFYDLTLLNLRLIDLWLIYQLAIRATAKQLATSNKYSYCSGLLYWLGIQQSLPAPLPQATDTDETALLLVGDETSLLNYWLGIPLEQSPEQDYQGRQLLYKQRGK